MEELRAFLRYRVLLAAARCPPRRRRLLLLRFRVRGRARRELTPDCQPVRLRPHRMDTHSTALQSRRHLHMFFNTRIRISSSNNSNSNRNSTHTSNSTTCNLRPILRGSLKPLSVLRPFRSTTNPDPPERGTRLKLPRRSTRHRSRRRPDHPPT